MVNKSAAIVIKNKRVLYLRKRNFLFYILPGGKIEKGEMPEKALHREMQEELSTKIKIRGHIGDINSKGFNRSMDKLETIKLRLYRVRLLGDIKLAGEIIDKAYLKYKNIHRYLLTPVGIKTLQFLHQKKLIE